MHWATWSIGAPTLYSPYKHYKVSRVLPPACWEIMICICSPRPMECAIFDVEIRFKIFFQHPIDRPISIGCVTKNWQFMNRAG